MQMLVLIFTTLASVWYECCRLLMVLRASGVSSFLETDACVTSDVDISAANGILDFEHGFGHPDSKADGADENLFDGLLPPNQAETLSQLTPNDELGSATKESMQILTVCDNHSDPINDELDGIYYDALETQEVLVKSDSARAEPLPCDVPQNRCDQGVNHCAENQYHDEIPSIVSNDRLRPTSPASATTLPTPRVNESTANGFSVAAEASGSAVTSRTTVAVVVPVAFQPLIKILNTYPGKRVKRQLLAQTLAQKHPGIYKVAGERNFTCYITAAASKGYVKVQKKIITLGSNAV
ncbi:hypothetical protein BD410DRAFT_902632 [Rickenella mellea]|uniref:Uncharacterized protein n=1 Tax=Rickenella mellea TaxID=50990 RepID=A0A4Y7PLD0_9AGAM|nr:hypothetical protein BD410DRAFT_902632 [Rickenella mellea]